MRYLRMLLNSVLAGGVVAAYMLIVLLQLNPGVPLGPQAIAPLVLALLLSYGLAFAVLFYVLLVLRQLFAQESLSPGWLSFRVLVWLCVMAAALGTALMWFNLRGLRLALDAEAARAMTRGAITSTVCLAMLVVLGAYRLSFGRQVARAGAVVFALVLVASVALPIWQRGPGRTPSLAAHRLDPDPSFASAAPSGRVTMLLVDGASLDFISTAAADGRLPNFGRILDAGAVMHLATLRPTQPAPVWTAVGTGKLPLRTGVRSAASYTIAPGGPTLDLLPDYCFAHALVYFGFLFETPHTSASLRVRPLWSILGASGVRVGIVRWPLTFPAQPVQGVIVSDELHAARDEGLEPGAPPVTYPADLVHALPARQPAAVPAATGADGGDAGSGAQAWDRFYSEVFDTVRETPGLQLLALRYRGLDTVGHAYLRHAMPREFGDVTDLERQRYGRVLEQYYRYIDADVGRAIDRLGPDDLLLVVSAFGMEPSSLPKRLLERALGTAPASGTHERAPDGFLLAYGRPVQPGRLPRASVLDVTPTVLYYFGLPIGHDMDGFARTEIFSPAFTRGRPLTFIPTYER